MYSLIKQTTCSYFFGALVHAWDNFISLKSQTHERHVKFNLNEIASKFLQYHLWLWVNFCNIKERKAFQRWNKLKLSLFFVAWRIEILVKCKLHIICHINGDYLIEKALLSREYQVD